MLTEVTLPVMYIRDKGLNNTDKQLPWDHGERAFLCGRVTVLSDFRSCWSPFKKSCQTVGFKLEASLPPRNKLMLATRNGSTDP